MRLMPDPPVKEWPAGRLIRSGLAALVPPAVVLVLSLAYWSGWTPLLRVWQPLAGTVVDWVLTAVFAVAFPLYAWYCGRVLLYRQERRAWAWALFFAAPLLMIAIFLAHPPAS